MNKNVGSIFLKAFAGSLAARIVSLGATALMVPLMASAVKSEDYWWIAASISICTFISYTDFGLSFLGVNVAAECLSGKKEKINEFIFIKKTLIKVNSWLKIIAFAAVFLSATNYGWGKQTSLALCIFCVVLSVPSVIGSRIIYADNKVIEANIWTMAGRVFLLICVWFGSLCFKNDVPIIILLANLPQVVIQVVQNYRVKKDGVYACFYEKIKVKNTSYLLNKEEILIICKGVQFTVMQAAQFLEGQADALFLVSAGLQKESLSFDIYQKMFSYILTFSAMVLSPLWPTIAKLRSQPNGLVESKKLESNIVMYMIPMLVFSSTVLLMFSQEIAKIWTKVEIELPKETCVALAVLAILTSVSYYQSMVLNGRGLVKAAAITSILYLVCVVPAKFIGGYFYGSVGIVGAGCIVVMMRILYFVKIIKKDSRSDAI